MRHVLKGLLFSGLLATAPAMSAWAQTTPSTESPAAAYARTVNDRAAKIVEKLGLSNAATATQVQAIIARQYRDLNDLHEQKKVKLAALKAQPATDETKAEAQKTEAATDRAISKLHTQYLSRLGRKLTPAQVDQVKDGMTYGVLPITVRAYQDMLPDLTEAQKTQIVAWLTEAREHAMDAGTSDQKHAWFGKYKGKINNYLSAAGIDMKQAGKDWQARLQAAGSK